MSSADRRQRLHALVLALLSQQKELELLDGDDGLGSSPTPGQAAGWLERNRRVLQRYQALVRSAATLDALIEQELNEQELG
ncbi:MAG: hypothetical protein VKK62_02060 [Synechococcaceae cyanobacterium]|nr:hypothetical protein [Synechococcaceae cyanobacterium]